MLIKVYKYCYEKYFKDVDVKELMFINSDVIFNRPDVLAVEKELEKANKKNKD